MLYDGLDRLRQASGPWGAGSFSYDALDNLTASTVGTRSLTHHIDAATNRLMGFSGSQSLAIGYDANGNVAQRGAQAFVFDIGNRLRSAVGKASYVYDGHGRRSRVQYNASDTLLQAYTQDGKLRFAWRQSLGSRRYVYLGDRLIAETTAPGGVPTYVHTDALGSPVAKTNSAKAVVERTRYEPYGATVAMVGSTNPKTIGFTGHVNDGDTGLVYMQQRYYDPITGRFLSVDPVVTSGTNGASFNRYAYALANPLRFVDLEGRASSEPRGEKKESPRERYERQVRERRSAEGWAINVYTTSGSSRRNPGIGIAQRAVADGQLSYSEANAIWSNNNDPGLVVVVDAGTLTVRQTSAFGRTGTATGTVAGISWFVYGSVTLQRVGGRAMLLPDHYDFTYNDPSRYSSVWRGHARNFEAYGGFYFASRAGFSVGVDYTIRFMGQPTVIYEP